MVAGELQADGEIVDPRFVADLARLQVIELLPDDAIAFLVIGGAVFGKALVEDVVHHGEAEGNDVLRLRHDMRIRERSAELIRKLPDHYETEERTDDRGDEDREEPTEAAHVAGPFGSTFESPPVRLGATKANVMPAIASAAPAPTASHCKPGTKLRNDVAADSVEGSSR